MSEANIAVMKRFIADYQMGHDDATLRELVADDFVDHSAMPGLPPGRDGVKVLFDLFHAAFADFRVEVYDQVAAGDRVVTRKAFFGRHAGDFLGVAATGRD